MAYFQPGSDKRFPPEVNSIWNMFNIQCDDSAFSNQIWVKVTLPPPPPNVQCTWLAALLHFFFIGVVFSILKLLILRPRSFQNIGLKYFIKKGFEQLRETTIFVSTIGLTFSLWLKICYNILKRSTPG